MHPRIFLTAEKVSALRSVDEIRKSTRTGHGARLWEEIRAGAQADVKDDPLVPASTFPGRDPVQAQHANRDFTVCRAVQMRLHRCALAALLTNRRRYSDAALRQMEALFDEEAWPEWRDLSHQFLGIPADLRTGMLSKSVALAYDWIQPMLMQGQRDWVLDGIERCGIEPFRQSVAAGAWWFHGNTNWTTCVTGGLGIAGMALGSDHAQAPHLVDLSLPPMRDYQKVLGPEGEHNESVAYAGSMEAPVEYWTAYRYYTDAADNVLERAEFAAFARWYMHFVVPPGCVAPFGDSHPGGPPQVSMYAALAAATRDGVLQWFYLNHCGASERRDPVMELLCYDPAVKPVSPEGRMPRSRAYRAHGACVSSRSDWDPRAACMVYSKGGHGNETHGHHDAGQVCIEAEGAPLIVDLGAPSLYPADFFGPNRWKYYNAGAWGHNVLVFGGREMRTGEDDRAAITAAEFDDARGGYWVLDTTALYDGARAVRRTVVHLLPGVVAVLDDAELEQKESVSLRWHTADRCEPEADGSFVVRAAQASLAGRVARLDGGDVEVSRGEHEYAEPFDRGRIGDPLEQRRESFIEGRLTAKSCRLLTLFAVFRAGEETGRWEEAAGDWKIETPDGTVSVTVPGKALTVRNLRTAAGWDVTTA
jgi:hypothetical protein